MQRKVLTDAITSRRPPELLVDVAGGAPQFNAQFDAQIAVSF